MKDTGLCFGLAEDMFGVFPCQNRWSWDTASLLFLPTPHLSTPQSPVHESMRCFACNPMKEPHLHQQQLDMKRELEKTLSNLSIKISLILTESFWTISLLNHHHPSPVIAPSFFIYYLLTSPALLHVTYMPVLGDHIFLFLAMLPLPYGGEAECLPPQKMPLWRYCYGVQSKDRPKIPHSPWLGVGGWRWGSGW